MRHPRRSVEKAGLAKKRNTDIHNGRGVLLKGRSVLLAKKTASTSLGCPQPKESFLADSDYFRKLAVSERDYMRRGTRSCTREPHPQTLFLCET